MNTPRFTFFGTPQLSVIVLEQLKAHGLMPTLVVTAPDKPAGRGMQMQQSPVKTWAHAHVIPTLEPTVFNDGTIARLSEENSDVYVLVAYGTILPKEVVTLPPHGILNVHPSLLPLLRGPSPVRSAILQDHQTVGVSVMKLDEKMDHGPILVQETYTPEVWPPDADALDTYLFERGGALLAEVLPDYITGAVELQEQDHTQATYCSLFTKDDGALDLNAPAYENLLKIHAYAGWPGTYFFAEKDGVCARIKVLSAHIEHDALIFDEVIPEGKSRISGAELLKTYTLMSS